jgi:C-terminal processing protease CtpA/Prc
MRQVSMLMKRLGTAALLLTTVLSFGYLDLEADKKPAVRKPLQAGLQHTEKMEVPKRKVLRAQTDDSGGALRGGLQNGGMLGKARGGARTAQTDTLKGGNKAGGFNVAATSGFGIIGVKFSLSLGKPPVINRVFPGTPASTLGMQKDDVIVAVDGVPTYGLMKEEVYDLIIGSPGTKVNVSIMRAGDFHVYTCTRMDINDLTDPVVRRDYLTSM